MTALWCRNGEMGSVEVESPYVTWRLPPADRKFTLGKSMGLNCSR
jgi:hypothetical protein